MTDALVLHHSEILLEERDDHHFKKPEMTDDLLLPHFERPDTTDGQLPHPFEKTETTDGQLLHPFEINRHRQTDTAVLTVMEDSETTYATTMMML